MVGNKIKQGCSEGNKKSLFYRSVSVLILYCQLIPIVGAAVISSQPVLPTSSSYFQTNKTKADNVPSAAGPFTPLLNYAQTGIWNNLSLSNKQIGLDWPLDLGLTYSDLTGAYLNAQYMLPLGEQFAFGALGEYGANQYRLNGTLGYSLRPGSQFKTSVERLGQRLPFEFDSGTIDSRVHQMAYGGRFQQLFNSSKLQGFNAGAYWAQANSKELAPIFFTSNGLNCAGFAAGLSCVNFRNLAGARSKGLDAGIDFLLTPATLVKTNLYYDQVHYRTQFNPINSLSEENRSGLGVGFKIDQLLGQRFKILGETSLREIYDTYQAGFSFIPTWGFNTELSLVGQHIQSHNTTPNNTSININLSLFADGAKHYNIRHSREFQSNDIGQWVRVPAVKMNQVLAIAEQITKLVAPTISGITPNSGSFAGGNAITIIGSNFVEGLLVFFSGKLASNIQVLSSTRIRVIVPPQANSSQEVVDVIVQNPDGQKALLTDGYTYLGSSLPAIYSVSPTQGSNEGGTTVTLIGANLGTTKSVSFGGVAGTITQITDTQVKVLSPPNVEGPVAIILTTAAGSTSKPSAYTYTAAPSITQQPQNQSVLVGSTATFSAQATGTPVPIIQWQLSTDGTTWVDIPNANSSPYTTPILLLSDNGNRYRAVFTNSSGQAFTNAAFLTVSSVILPPIITSVGNVPEGGITNNLTPQIDGTGLAGATVTLYNGMVVLGTAVVNGNGAWTYTPTLSDGAYSFSATQTDLNGNTSNASPPYSITVDSTSPPAPSGVQISPAGTQVTGISEPGDTIIVRDQNGVVLGQATAAADGTFTVILSPPQINGEILEVVAIDEAGNSSPSTVITAPDLIAPLPPVITSVFDDTGPITGVILNGGVTDDATPTLAGTSEVGTEVRLLDNGVLIGNTTTDPNGNWLFTPLVDLTEGNHVFTAIAVDANQNSSGASNAYSITIDTTAPAAPSNVQISADGASMTGASEPGATISVEDQNGVLLASAIVGSNGLFLVSFSPPLNNGELVNVYATDLAGNRSVPTVVQAPPLAPYNLSMAAGDSSISGNTTPNSQVAVSLGNTVIGTSYADASGVFSMNTTPLQVTGQQLTLTASLNSVNSSATVFNAPHTCIPLTTNNLPVTVTTGGGATVSNASNVINANLSDAATISSPILATGTIRVSSNPSYIYPASSLVGFQTTSILSLLNNITLTTYLGGVLAESFVVNFGAMNAGYYEVTSSQPFDAVQIALTSSFGLSYQVNYLCAG